MWSKERVIELKKLWDQGLTASQIATAMGDGLTRNAVMGKVHRLGLKPRRFGERSFWNVARVALLKELWSTKLSAAKIAGVIGNGSDVTRNAVISKAQRLGLSSRKKSPSEKRVSKE